MPVEYQTREALESVCNKKGPTYFQSTCHPIAPTWTYYQERVIVIVCSVCGYEVTRILL